MNVKYKSIEDLSWTLCFKITNFTNVIDFTTVKVLQKNFEIVLIPFCNLCEFYITLIITGTLKKLIAFVMQSNLYSQDF